MIFAERLGISVVVSLAFTAFTFVSTTRAHEIVHSIIFEDFGARSEQRFKALGFNAQTQRLSPYRSSQDRRAANLAHAFNDALSYNLSFYLLSLIFLLSLLVSWQLTGG